MKLMHTKHIIKKLDSFELIHTFDCGQCFRWNKELNGSYTGVFKNNVLNIKKEQDSFIFQGLFESDDVEGEINKYFDLNRDYGGLKNQLVKVDKYMKSSIEYGYGIRILNQDLWETTISFIISANNNIPRIKGIIERLSKSYGTQLDRNGHQYFTFPTAEQLKDVSVENYRKLGLGFRDERIYQTVRMVLDGIMDLNSLYKKDTQDIREELLKLSGVGPKVADCIMLFSDLKRREVFPIDVRVRRVMNQLYIHNPDESKVSKQQIESMAHEKFGDYAGLAQEYLFYRARTQKFTSIKN